MELTISEKLAIKKNEIQEITDDISHLEKEAGKLKPTVTEYNAKKRKISALKKLAESKEERLNIMVEFLNEIDSHYTDELFPLFKDSKKSTVPSIQTQAGATC